MNPSLRATGLLKAMAALVLSATPGQAIPVDPVVAAPAGQIVEAQFLGGPFFGRHGYYQPDPAKRHYFYEGYDPSLNPYNHATRKRSNARRHRTHVRTHRAPRVAE